jgi:DnaJ-class molecular chaperone
MPTLDGRTLFIVYPEIISLFYQKLIPAKGMPPMKTPLGKGDMIVRFHILFLKFT